MRSEKGAKISQVGESGRDKDTERESKQADRFGQTLSERENER